MIDYAILEQFVTFYQTGTLRETAKKLHISQPALTRNMQKLESEFDVPLFHRTKNRIYLNETGILAAEEASALIKQTRNLILRVQDFDRSRRTINIGVCTPIHVADIVQRITSIYPMNAISSEVKDISVLLDGVKNDTYQFVLLPFCPADDDLTGMKWSEEHLSFLLPKKHRFSHRKSLSVAEVNGENILLFQDIGFWYNLVLNKMPDSRFLIQTDNYTFLELIKNSTMVSFSTDAFQNIFPDSRPAEDHVCIPITDPEFNVSYYLVCKTGNQDRLKSLFPNIS